ncbi:hypothetical protein PHYC_03095 [Phycisphaerales bacterium]|nr:hypothetical protein PHYC_03095 [Phycisphaerales bacterium]
MASTRAGAGTYDPQMDNRLRILWLSLVLSILSTLTLALLGVLHLTDSGVQSLHARSDMLDNVTILRDAGLDIDQLNKAIIARGGLPIPYELGREDDALARWLSGSEAHRAVSNGRRTSTQFFSAAAASLFISILIGFSRPRPPRAA